MTVRVRAPANAGLAVEILDSAGEVAGKGSGSVGPEGGSIDLALDVDLLPDDADRPARLDPNIPLLERIALSCDQALLQIGDHGASLDIQAECLRLVRDAAAAANAMDEAIADPDGAVEDCLRDARAALARRLARIGHLEARHVERAARVAGEPRATG